MKLAGLVLDVHDDVNRDVVCDLNPDIKSKLSEWEPISADRLSGLPDHVFALVSSNGDDVVRKYAMHDPDHHAVSMLYFVQQKDLLPEPARKVAAHNLANACSWYGVRPPEVLVKEAGAGKLLGGGLGVGFLGMQASEGMKKVKKDRNKGYAAQRGMKLADLTGTEVMSRTGDYDNKPLESSNNTARKDRKKRAEWLPGPDLTHLDVPVHKVAAETQHYCLPGSKKYPVDSYEQVKEAEQYFDAHISDFVPEDRRTYAQNLSVRAEELGIPVRSEKIAAYAGNDYGTAIQGELRVRADTVKEGSSYYETMLEHLDSTPPEAMAEMLKTADAHFGISQTYDSPMGFWDPYRAVYGKVAEDVEESWSWIDGGDYVNAEMLRDLANNRYKVVSMAYGEDFMHSFQKDPVEMFDSLPLPQKRVISRLARDNSTGSYRGF